MAVTNAEIKEMIKDEIMPFVQANTQRSEDNTRRVEAIEPEVETLKLVIFGDPKDRKDEGIVGVLNNLDELVQKLRALVTPITVSIIIAIIMFIARQGFTMWLDWQLLQ